jgi:hypothetical protein
MVLRRVLIQQISPLAKRIAADLGVDDVRAVQEAIKRRAPGVLSIHVRFDELSRDQYDDLCDAVEDELCTSGTR